MKVFHAFKIVQTVPNRAKHHNCRYVVPLLELEYTTYDFL